MNRKTLISLAAFVVLGLGAFFALRRPEVGERTGDKPRPVAKIAAGDVDTLTVTRNLASTVIKKDGGKYKVTSPVAYAADETFAKNAFEAIEKLEFGSLVTEQKAKQAEFEVEDAKGVRVVAKGANGTVLADLLVGKSQGTGTMVRPSGKDEIWEANGSIRYTFDKAPADWRDKSITTFTLGDAEKVDIKAKDGSTIALKKNGEKWEVANSSVKIDKLDDTIAGGIVSALSTFKASDFADGLKSADTGLEPPSLTLTVGLKGGKSATVLVGGKKGDDDFYVKTSDAPQIFVVKKYNIERVNKRPVEFRDKTLCNVADADLGDISVASSEKERSYAFSKSGSDWKASKPAKLELDSSKVTPIAGAFKEWKASSFAEDTTPATTGLDKPKAVISVKSKKAADSCTIKVGNETKDKQSYYVQSAKAGDIMLVQKWSADRILVKPDDLKKAGGTSVAKK
jgi:hypothetical protein